MSETIEDYVLTYNKHKQKLFCADETVLQRETKIMENIIQGAVLKFKIKRAEFKKLVE
jgi:hypothetical protein